MSLKNSLIKFSYFLATSKKYKNYKSFIYEILEDQSSYRKRYFDLFMIFLVLSTVFILIYEIKNPLPEYIEIYEIFAIVIFIIEWLGRFWVSSDIHISVIENFEKSELMGKSFALNETLKEVAVQKLKYIFSPMSIIDLLAILPSYRPLRILRIFLLFRLFKIFRYTQSINFFMKIFVEKRFEFLTLMILFGFMVFFSSTIIYIYESVGINKNIETFFDAIYWSIVTITTVGYGDITPASDVGRIITTLLIIGGLGIIAFGTSIITTALTEKIEIIKENRVKIESAKLKNFILICGYGTMGEILADELANAKEKFIIIDSDAERVLKAKLKNYMAISADATDIEVLKELNVEKRAKSVIALTKNDALNLSIILSAKALNEHIYIIARANQESSKKKFKIAGANKIIFPYETTALTAVEYIGQPVAFDAIDNILLEREETVIDEMEVLENSKLDGKKINEVDLKIHGLKLIGVVQGDETREFLFNPKETNYSLRNKDILILMGKLEDISAFKIKMFKGIKLR